MYISKYIYIFVEKHIIIYIHIICIYRSSAVFSSLWWMIRYHRPIWYHIQSQAAAAVDVVLAFVRPGWPTHPVSFVHLYRWCEQTPHVVKMHETNKSDLNQFRSFVDKFMNPMHEKKKLDTWTNKWANIQVNIGPYSSKNACKCLLKRPFLLC